VIDPAMLAPVLQAIALAMAGTLLLLILLLVVQKLVLERRARAIEEASNRYARALAGATRPVDLRVDPRRLIERRALARALAAAGSGIPNGQLRGAPWYGDLVDRLQKDAVHRKWGGRVAAFEMLGDLGAAELRPFLEEAARRERHPQAYAACLACLAKFVDEASSLTTLWKELRDNPPLSGSFNEGLARTAIGALIRRHSADTAADAVRQLLAVENPQDPLTLDLISAVGKSGLTPLVPRLAALHGRAGAPKPLRIACVRAVGMLQPDHPLLLDALADRDWEVRAIGARYLRGTAPGVLAGLSSCLTSSAFYVRYNAASTLAALGEQGRAALEHAVTSADPFARDISRYALRVLQFSHV
jgi:hypothetical protein